MAYPANGTLTHRFLQALAIGFLLLYFGVSFAGWFALDSVSPYAIYGFQALFGLIILLIYRNWQWKIKSLSFAAGVALFFAFAAGFSVVEACEVLHYAIPVSFKDPETVLWLLVLSPVLEEWVFRGALWKLFERITGSPWPAFLLTAIASSYSHYAAISSLDPKYAPFLRFQAIFILGLGLICGGLRLQFGWFAAAIAHVVFNFGFWLGAIL
jgi:hypothetical protein